jgi:uncharacterized protein YndB with AHSA1/START domain
MITINVETHIPATRSQVWDCVSDISSHTEWMMDAERIDFVTDQRVGVGTAFDCFTKVGPIKMTDRMEVTQWLDDQRMGVRHSGFVTGTGVFTLTANGSGTVFSWREQLAFPWYLGGRVAELVAKPVLTKLWEGNLRRLNAQVVRYVKQ